MKTRERALNIVTVEKTTMTQYPTMARPVITQVAYEEFRSLTGRPLAVQNVRKETPSVKFVTRNMAKAYFKSDWEKISADFKKNPIIYDPKEILKWTSERRGAPKIYNDTLKLLSQELCTKPLNDINVHVKVEALLKEQPIDVMQ